MYLNGNRLKVAAKLRHLTLEDVQQRSGLPAEQAAYYWDYPITVTNQEDVNALAKLLGIDGDLLVAHGEPKEVFLRPDKFVWQDDDITFI